MSAESVSFQRQNVERHNFCSKHVCEQFSFNALGEIVLRGAVPERRSAWKKQAA
jgi:hypothetical protein